MDWLHILTVGLIIYLVIGAEKMFRRSQETRDSDISKIRVTEL